MKVLPLLVAALLLGQSDGPRLKFVAIKCSFDDQVQSARWYAPPGSKKRKTPLVVLLHTWSGNFEQTGFAEEVLQACAERSWALIHPDFRGPNVRPAACGSDAAVRDVLDALKFAKEQARIDPERVYLVGTSGGGHMALVMAHRAPEKWSAVSSWVPVTDLAAWHRETKEAGRKYWKDLEKVCGGPPGISKAVDAEYRKRSPLYHLAAAKGVAIDLNVGIHDGYTGSIPVTHSLRAFNALAEANEEVAKKLSAKQIEFMRAERKVPADLGGETVEDGSYKRKILLRRQAGPVRLTVFDGSHEGDMKASLGWFTGRAR